MIKGIALCCFVAALIIMDPASAFAWGNEGHRIVCRIALNRLSPAGLAFVDAVRALHTEVQDPFDTCQTCSPTHASDARNMSFLEGCIWADEARRDTFKGTYEYHFINVPKAATGFDLLRDCGSLDCVLVGIQRYSQYLAKTPSQSSREKERQVLALRFLGHFVGDLHQPLHTGFTEDLGGNRIDMSITENGQTRTDDLHAVWDGVILRKGGLTTIADADALNTEITATEAAQFATLSIVNWATEAHTIARQLAYTKSDGSAVEDGDTLDEAYFTRALDAVKLQLKKAGVRLAALIEAAAGGTMPEHLLNVAP